MPPAVFSSSSSLGMAANSSSSIFRRRRIDSFSSPSAATILRNSLPQSANLSVRSKTTSFSSSSSSSSALRPISVLLSPAQETAAPSIVAAEAWRQNGEAEECGEMKELVGAVKRDLARLGDELMGDDSALLDALKMVDLIERLGIQRFFREHIDRILLLSYLEWHERFGFNDAAATVLGFRLLRLHGYHVSAGILESWKDGESGVFTPFAVDTPANISAMIDLFRCSQVGFPSESQIMDAAGDFSSSQLRKALLQGDKSLLSDGNLGREIRFALEYPRRYLLPRLESRSVIRRLWASSTGCRKRCLQIAKLDLEVLQKLHHREIAALEQWWEEQECSQTVNFRGGTVKCYVAVSAAVHEPQFSAYRCAFSQVACFATVLDDIFDSTNTDPVAAAKFNEAVQRWDPAPCEDDPELKALFASFYSTMEEMTAQSNRVQGRDVSQHLRAVWQDLIGLYANTEAKKYRYVPTSMAEYLDHACLSISAAVVTWSSLFLMNEFVTDEALRLLGKDSRFMRAVSCIARLANDVSTFEREVADGEFGSGVSCYMRDNPGCTQAEALAGVGRIAEEQCRELEWEMFRAAKAGVPECCVRALANFARTMCFVYKRGDAYSLDAHDGEYENLVEDYLFKPLLL